MISTQETTWIQRAYLHLYNRKHLQKSVNSTDIHNIYFINLVISLFNHLQGTLRDLRRGGRNFAVDQVELVNALECCSSLWFHGSQNILWLTDKFSFLDMSMGFCREHQRKSSLYFLKTNIMLELLMI